MTTKPMALQFRDLPDIDDVKPLGEEDRALMAELHQVLLRHKAVDRFGITLLHNHFPINEGEVLVEECDPVNRVLTIKPKAADQVAGGKTIQTNWRFHPADHRLSEHEMGMTLAGAILACMVNCSNMGGGHSPLHSASMNTR